MKPSGPKKALTLIARSRDDRLEMERETRQAEAAVMRPEQALFVWAMRVIMDEWLKQTARRGR